MSESEPFDPPERQSSQAALIGMAVVAALAILLAIAGFIYVMVARGVSDSTSDRGAGKRLPVIELVPLTGGGQPIGADNLKGRVVLLNVWATWCGPCELEFPHVVELYEEFSRDQQFMMISLSVGKGIEELRIDTERFLKRKDAKLPTYADPTGATINGIMQVTGKAGVPQTLLLDRTGTVREVWVGYRPGVERQMQQRIKELLAEPSVEIP